MERVGTVIGARTGRGHREAAMMKDVWRTLGMVVRKSSGTGIEKDVGLARDAYAR